MPRLWSRLILSLALVLAVVVPAAPAFAGTNPFKDTCAIGAAKNSAVCQTPGGDAITSTNGIIRRVTLIIAILGGVAAVIVLAVGGVRYITSNGDAEQITRAKRTIIYAIIGLAAIVLGQTIISFVIFRV